MSGDDPRLRADRPPLERDERHPGGAAAFVPIGRAGDGLDP
jgi:hypothetical protein